ncbi:MAG: hypothetical protein M3Y64_09615 [Gemmatimonadota bacterium]|nr:hypothetical protein [Gemmatimonadota bacterium]
MQHLDPERIAAFDHEPPSVDELAHLAACKTCRRERAALIELAQMAFLAGDEPVASFAPRLTNWETLSARLRTEGLIANAPPAVIASEFAVKSTTTSWLARATPGSRVEWWRAAAAILILVAAGATADRLIAFPLAQPESGVSSASIASGVGLGSSGFSSIDDATKALGKTQKDFDRISLWLAANDTTLNSPDRVRRRLAALDQMLAASRAGVEDAPQDPVLKHYYSAAYAAREATLQQLNGALPVGRSLERY